MVGVKRRSITIFSVVLVGRRIRTRPSSGERMGSLNRFFGSSKNTRRKDDTASSRVTRNVTQTTRGREGAWTATGGRSKKWGRRRRGGREREGTQCLSEGTAVTNSGLQPEERGVERQRGDERRGERSGERERERGEGG